MLQFQTSGVVSDGKVNIVGALYSSNFYEICRKRENLQTFCENVVYPSTVNYSFKYIKILKNCLRRNNYLMVYLRDFFQYQRHAFLTSDHKYVQHDEKLPTTNNKQKKIINRKPLATSVMPKLNLDPKFNICFIDKKKNKKNRTILKCNKQFILYVVQNIFKIFEVNANNW
ncbi:hypothetical protein AGLY_004514 [Aphis glycines]|uniref:Uncharacterized protein n=1 Tax=Aphis glycines TaxID=307491 RepID=A0A6G0TYA0_APHGL|nr:hypothetical protein AGLY_004514 [Aphis glycines]